MKRSTVALIALLAILATAAVYVGWRVANDRRRPVAETAPTLAPATAQPNATARPTATTQPATAEPTVAPHLTAALDPALDLADHPPKAPITLTFDRPIAFDPELRPLAITPSVSGVFAWNDDVTAVTFTPETHFQPGTRYRLTAAAELRGADGATFDEPPAWSLDIAQPPRVRSRTPSATSGTDRRPAITLAFTRAMDRDSVEAALSVEPPVLLDLSWEDDALTLRPAELLDPGVAYNFTLSGDATDSRGVGLIGVYGFRYTPSPVITRVEGPTRANPDAPLLIRFGYPMDWDATVPALTIDPPIDAEIHRLDESTLQLIDPPLLGNTEYAFSFSAAVRDGAGDPLPIPAGPAVYKSPSPVLAFFPSGNNVHPAAVLRVNFDRPMDPATTAAALVLSPPVVGEIAWEGDSALLFTPEGGFWQPETKYEVTLGTGAADAAGRPVLGQPHSHSFTTGEERHVGDWGVGPQTQVLDADGRRAVQFQTGINHPLSLDFDLLPLDQTGFLNRIVGDVTSHWSEPADPIADDGLSPVTSWTTQTTPGHPDSWGNPQETLIPPDAPPGLYLLRLNGLEPANLLLALSRMTLVAKLSAGEIVVWVTDIDSRGANDVDITQSDANEGGPIPNAAIQVYAQNGRLLAEGTTDERGVARLPLPAGDEPYVVFATSATGDDTTFSALTPEMQARGEYYGWWRQSPPSLSPPAFAVHVQTDRPIYRPGQTVFYKAILRLDDDGAVSLPPIGTQAIVRLRDGRDNVVITRFLATDEFGAVYDSFNVAEGAMLGEYAVEVEPVRPGGGADAPTRQTFQVEEYRKPDFSVTIVPETPMPDAAEVLAGDTLTVTIAADYLFGEPVAGATVDIKTYRLWNYGYWGAEDIWETDPAESLRRSTDASGRLTVSVPVGERPIDFGYWAENPSSWRLAVEATVNDGSNQTVSATAVVTVHRAAEFLALETPGYVVEFSSVAPFTATVTTTLGDPLPVEGRSIQGSLRVWSNQTFDYNTVVAEHEWTTGPDGVISAHLTPPGPGHYQMRLVGHDENGRVYYAETYFYVLGEGESNYWSDRRQTGLSVSADRESYAPGDTARLLVTTDFAGPALLTFERAAVRREMPVMLTPPITVIEVPILPEDAPNIFVTVNAWEPITTVPPASFGDETWLAMDSQRDAELRTATVELSVPVTDRALTVTIETDQDVYAPRDEAAVTVRVTDAAGQPVRAQVALAMVDEAIFLLADDNTRPLHDAFYGPRLNRVLSRDAMAPGRYLYQGGLGGGGGGLMEAPRSDFPDTAAWFPALATDENGELRLSIPLADSLTTWRLTARAVTAADTSVGEAVHKFTTHQDVIIRPILPRGLTAGDEIVLSAVVHNYGDEAIELDVSLSDEAGLLAIAAPSQSVTLEPGATQVVGWPVAAAVAGETAALAVAALPDGSGDAVELPLVVRELAVPVYDYAAGRIEGAGEIALDRPDDALPTSAVTLEVNRSPAGSLLNGLEYLTGFPYGCVEQTMSRALPNAVVSRAFNRLGIPPPVELDLDRLVNESAQKLYGFQHEEGGWGWWFDDDGDPYQTAWVLFGLATMAEAGHEIDPGVIERGAAFLRERLDGMDPRVRAYALYSLAVAGELDEAGAGAALALLDEVETSLNPRLLDPYSLAALALALDAAGEAGAAQTAMDRLAAEVETDGDMAYWNTGVDGQYDRKVMASSTRSTAVALSAFVKLRPGDDLEPLIVNYLMAQRRGNGWGTTNETAHAVIALTDHLLGAGLGQTTAAYSVLLNGEPLAEGTLEAGELRDVIDVPLDRLEPGANAVTLTAADGGRLYYTLNERYQAARETIEAGGEVSVTRVYRSPDGGAPVESVAAGDLVLVRLVVRFPRDARFVVVEDHVPAGLEPLNERLNTTVHDAGFFGARTYSWNDLGYNYKEIREGRVTFFVTSLGGFTSTFEYLARATHDGTFVALPAEAWAMYEPEVWGRSGSDELRVTSDE